MEQCLKDLSAILLCSEEMERVASSEDGKKLMSTTPSTTAGRESSTGNAERKSSVINAKTQSLESVGICNSTEEVLR